MTDTTLTQREAKQTAEDGFDYQRVRKWMLDPARKRANAAFTAGPERNAAYLIEDYDARSPLENTPAQPTVDTREEDWPAYKPAKLPEKAMPSFAEQMAALSQPASPLTDKQECAYCDGNGCTHPPYMQPKKSRLTNEWLQHRIATDPDVDVEAGSPLTGAQGVGVTCSKQFTDYYECMKGKWAENHLIDHGHTFSEGYLAGKASPTPAVAGLTEDEAVEVMSRAYNDDNLHIFFPWDSDKKDDYKKSFTRKSMKSAYRALLAASQPARPVGEEV